MTMEPAAEPTFIQTAPRHLQAVLRNERALTRWIARERFERARIGYRAIDAAIANAGGCVRDVGLFSRYRGDDDFPWERQLIVHHLTDGRGRNTDPNHTALQSPYMSMSTSPERIVNFITQRVDQKEVVVIDMDMLDIMKLNYRKTTDLEQEFKFRDDDDGRTYTAESHYLVYEHIPQYCILGYMSGNAFTNIWQEKLATIRLDPDHQGPEQLDWHIDLESHPSLNKTSTFSKNPQFTDPSPGLQRTMPSSSGRFQRTMPTQEGSPTWTRNSLRKHARDPSTDATISPDAEGSHRRVYRKLF